MPLFHLEVNIWSSSATEIHLPGIWNWARKRWQHWAEERATSGMRSLHRAGREAGLVLMRRAWWHWTELSQHEWARWWLCLRYTASPQYRVAAISNYWTEMSQSTNGHIGGWVSGTQQSFNKGWLQSISNCTEQLHNSTQPPLHFSHLNRVCSLAQEPCQEQTINTPRLRVTMNSFPQRETGECSHPPLPGSHAAALFLQEKGRLLLFSYPQPLIQGQSGRSKGYSL